MSDENLPVRSSNDTILDERHRKSWQSELEITLTELTLFNLCNKQSLQAAMAATAHTLFQMRGAFLPRV